MSRAIMTEWFPSHRDETDTPAWEHAVAMLNSEPRQWVCACGEFGYVLEGTAAADNGGLPNDVLEADAEVRIAADGAPVFEFACPSCGVLLNVDEDGTR